MIGPRNSCMYIICKLGQGRTKQVLVGGGEDRMN